MTAPVVGSGDCPAWTARVPKPALSVVVTSGAPSLGEVLDEIDLGDDAGELVAVLDDDELGVVEDGPEEDDAGRRGHRRVVALDQRIDRIVELALGDQVAEEIGLGDEPDHLPALVEDRDLRDRVVAEEADDLADRLAAVGADELAL